MAEWKKAPLKLPPGLEDAIGAVGDVAGAVADFLDTVRAALDVASAVAGISFDLYSAIVNEFIASVEAFLTDIGEAGVYVLVDYPQNLNAARLNPISRTNLAGTLLDSRGGISNEAITLGDDRRTVEGRTRLQEVASRRKTWNPVSRDILSFDEAMERIAKAFDDIQDPLRPRFSDSANTYGVVILAHSESLATFLKLSRSISSIFAVDSLSQLGMPGFSEFFDDIKEAGKEFSDLTQDELNKTNFTIGLDKRQQARHPNFTNATRLRDLIPIIGDSIDALIALIEAFRPTGSISDFIQTILRALEEKVSRINDTVTLLEDLAEQIEELGSTEFSVVAIESNTGNTGFTTDLINSTGHPEFDSSLVLTLTFYAGGPGARVLKQLFGGAGDRIEDSIQNAQDAAERNRARPVLTP